MGNKVSKIVLEDQEFWSQCQHIVKISEPLVKILHLVDGDKKSAMGYLYEAMDKIKEEIKVKMKHHMLNLLIVDGINSFIVLYIQRVVFLTQKITLGLHLPRKVKFTEGYYPLL